MWRDWLGWRKDPDLGLSLPRPLGDAEPGEWLLVTRKNLGELGLESALRGLRCFGNGDSGTTSHVGPPRDERLRARERGDGDGGGDVDVVDTLTTDAVAGDDGLQGGLAVKSMGSCACVYAYGVEGGLAGLVKL